MRIDVKSLREQYAALSDDALLEINRGDLVQVAQGCYDDELRKRALDAESTASRRRPRVSADRPMPDSPGPEPPVYDEQAGEKPAWLDEAAEVYSEYIRHGTAPAEEAARARDTLASAGIPTYLEVCEEKQLPAVIRRWRVLVPGSLNLRATSVLECEIFNEEFEAQWRAHLEGLSDGELEAITPEIAFGGLIDKIERATKAYEEELARRGLTAESS